jgi:hypothetical protein
VIRHQLIFQPVAVHASLTERPAGKIPHPRIYPACSPRRDFARPSKPRIQVPILIRETIFVARKLSALFGLVFLFSLSARAQSRVDVFGGYSYERFAGPPGRNLNGLEITGQYKWTNWFGLAADLDAHFGSPSQIDNRTLHFMAGPLISFPGRISPFVHVLGGIGHIRANGLAGTSFAAAVGGGLDMRLAPMLSWRIFQVDDVMTRFFGGTQHNARLSAGLVFRF